MTLTTLQDSANLLQQDQLSDEHIQRWLVPVGFTDCLAAYQSLQRLARDPAIRQILAANLPRILAALADTANPNHVLVNFERFIHDTPHPLELLHDFAGNPRILEILFKLFEGSQFLTEILLRQPHYFERLIAHHRLAQPKSADQLYGEAQAIIAHLLTGSPENGQITSALDELRRFQRWELLRIGASDLLGSLDLPTVTGQLSYLTDSLVQACLVLAARQTNIDPANFFVIAMGKLGGEELNYSSDIDLLFLADAEPMAYRQLGQQLIDGLTRITAEGFLYRVDMRLRPWGSTGPLVSSLEGYLAYLEKHARLWEKQALLKARFIAGNKELGRKFLEQIQPLLFNTELEVVRKEVHTLKQRIEAHLHQRGRDWGEVKLGEGSIRDIEFVTQYLQLVYGGKQPAVRGANTLKALSQLFSYKLLTADEYRVLNDGYSFLRTIEHHLQLMHYRQTNTLPEDEEALNHLAYRLGFQGSDVGKRFIARYRQHSAVIRLVYQQQLGQNDPPAVHNPDSKPKQDAATSPYLLPHMARMSASYIATFDEAQLEHHARLAEHLSHETPVKVEASRLDDQHWQVTIVGYDYLGELSLICGLLFVYGFNIVDGHVFSYEPSTGEAPAPVVMPRRTRRQRFQLKEELVDARPRIIDVFTVSPISDRVATDQWAAYESDLIQLVRRLQAGEQGEAQGELARRVALALHHNAAPPATTLYPIDIEIDNDASRPYTVLRIDALDTVGFLYELTNALALSDINIGHVIVETEGNRVRDLLYVTDRQGQKIQDPNKQDQLRAAIALIKQFTHLLPNSPNPEAALRHFREFLGQLFTHPNWPEELAPLSQPTILYTLARLLGASDFLWDDFLRMQHVNLFPVIQNINDLSEGKSKTELWAELNRELQGPDGMSQREKLNAFKDREMFRIDMRQIQGKIKEFGEFSGELTDLAEVVVEGAYHICVQELRASYGIPRLPNRQPCPLTIFALGKCGGRELGFASDIELMFIYEGKGRTTGPRVISNAEFYNKLVQEINSTIKTKREGIFEIDLRLRPYGKAGTMAVSLESFRRYFGPGGDAWPYERQALVKLRPFAGDMKLGQKVLDLRNKFIYSDQPFDVAAMRAMRERQIRHYVNAGTIHAKLSPGGLVDIEYLVQGLQITYGHLASDLREPNTRTAMLALAMAGFLPREDYYSLQEALNFLRNLINALRMVRGNARDLTVPKADTEEFAFLARRLDYGRENLAQLQHDLTHHMTCVQEINQRLLDQIIQTGT